MKLKFLKDRWDNKNAGKLGEPEKLRYRSNLLGADLRITNYGGGNTSSKIVEPDPLTGEMVEVLWVKGSGGDLQSITTEGFARLYMDKFLSLKNKYRGREFEDEMVDCYPLCRAGTGAIPASIDTPLHGLIPYKHVDHLHPDWAIALAAAANGRRLLAEFNRRFGLNLLWIGWQRPGYELGVILEKAIRENPQAEGLILASHGLISWANEQYECYRNTLEIIDAMGQFVQERVEQKGTKLFGGEKCESRKDRRKIAAAVFPFLRGLVSREKPVIGDFVDLLEILRFAGSRQGEKLAFQGTSCPDHFVRTRVRPLFVKWDPGKGDLSSLKKAVQAGFERYRRSYAEYYAQNREPQSPAMRGSNPTVVLIPGVGQFSFGKNRKEARITGEFYVNAIHVMEGATALGDGRLDEDADPQRSVENYLALSPREAFRIEYWALEEAKLRRQPEEKEMARRVAVVVGGGSGIGRKFCHRLAGEGAQVAVADIDLKAAAATVKEIENKFGAELAISLAVDITDRLSVREAFSSIALHFGGMDVLVNTAAIVVPPDRGDSYRDETWERILRINVSGNYIITEEFAEVIREQGSGGAVLLTSSANAVVPKAGSEPYDVSKAALNHLIRELAIRFAPELRINGISPATVVEGSAMFPRKRVIANLKKYGLKFDESEDTESLVSRLAGYYAGRTLTHRPVRPADVVEAGYFLISPRASRTTGHLFPVDGGLREAFLR